MLTLKIMSGESKADSDPDKDYCIIGGIKQITFRCARATEYECNVLNLAEAPEGKEWSVCLAECTFFDTNIVSNYLLNGNCYVLNDQGQTVDTYWPRNTLGNKK